jgi:2,3-bisphosphoglycerate-independent phosphoglycerate mutase
MKYVIVRCEDQAPFGHQAATLLAGAKTPHLQQLAQAGAAGTIQFKTDPPAIERMRCHRSLFGLNPRDPDGLPGRCYAAGANLQPEEGETAWCCELVTQRDGRVVDDTAGGISAKESEILVQALDDALGSDTRRWESGRGRHHVLIARDPDLGQALDTDLEPPELLLGHPWKRRLPKGKAGKALAALIEQAATILDSHPVNRVRIDLGENPANMIWLWGPAAAHTHRTFSERTGLSGMVVSNSFMLQGFARACSLGWREGAPSLEEAGLRQLMHAIQQAVPQHDFVYVHLSVESADPVERLCAMERIDQLIVKPLTDALPSAGDWRLLAAVDDRASGSVPFAAIGTGLPTQAAAGLSADLAGQSSLRFTNGEGLFAWLTHAPQ